MAHSTELVYNNRNDRTTTASAATTTTTIHTRTHGWLELHSYKFCSATDFRCCCCVRRCYCYCSCCYCLLAECDHETKLESQASVCVEPQSPQQWENTGSRKTANNELVTLCRSTRESGVVELSERAQEKRSRSASQSTKKKQEEEEESVEAHDLYFFYKLKLKCFKLKR